jgi:HD superfamily phosphodiesterase
MTDSAQGAPERLALVQQVAAWARHKLETGDLHTRAWFHTDRVRRTILTLARVEGVDPVLAELAALLHDVGRTEPGPESEHGARSAAETLVADLPLSDAEVKPVVHAIRWHNSGRADTQLLRVLRDADMLDGLGAIGIVRAFMGRSQLLPYDPDAPFATGGDRWPALFCSDQLLGQMDWYYRLNTATTRDLAQERFAFMERFIAPARKEIAIDD